MTEILALTIASCVGGAIVLACFLTDAGVLRAVRFHRH